MNFTTTPLNPPISRPSYKILHDPEKNEQLITKGHVVLDILSSAEVAYFSALYKKWHPVPPKEFYKSYFSSDMVYKKEVEDAIMNYCFPKIEKQFTDCNAFGAMFVVKPQGESGHIPPHQDWSFVDETKHWSLNMWLPIQDVAERDGSMRFLNGSQFFLETIRGAQTPELYNHLIQEIEQNLEDVPLKAGQAVFFYHGIVHCSHFNQMPEERVCLGLSLTQKEAPIYFHLLQEGEHLAEKFEVPVSFFIDYAHHRGQMPKSAVSLGKDQRLFNKLSKEELLQRIAQLKAV